MHTSPKTLGSSLASQTIDCSQVQFSDSRNISLSQLQALFNAAAFWAEDRSLDDLALALNHSYPVTSAWDGDRLIGFARATSDRVYRATIWDVVVSPTYQGAGIGRKLIHTLLSHPAIARVERVYLMTTQQQAFYQRIGFEVNPSTTMLLINQPSITGPSSEQALQTRPAQSSGVPADSLNPH